MSADAVVQVPARVDGPARELFPAIYRDLLPAVLDRHVPDEKLSTCSDCAMCAKPGEGSTDAAGVGYFNPDTKCCTFQPFLPNFLIGAALDDTDPAMAEGRRRLQDRIAARVDSWPNGLGPSAVQALHYEHRAPGAFGRSKALLCPYFVPGELNCSIWKHRNSVCSTYFCKHVKGEDGHAFWMASKRYAGHLESILSADLAFKLGARPSPEREEDAELSSNDLDGKVNERAYSRAWGEWAGRELEFFRECHRLARQLRRDDAVQIIGTHEDSTRDAEIQRAYERMFAPVPEALQRNPSLLLFPRPDGRLMARSAAGNFELTQELLEMLWAFDGRRSTAEASALMHERHGVSLSPALVEKLHRNRILVEPAKAGQERA